MSTTAALPFGSSTPAVSPSPYIVSQRYDLLFFSGSVLVPLALWGAFSLGWITGLTVAAIFQLAFNMPHNYQTWTMSLLDRADRHRNGRRYLVAVVVATLLLGGSMVLSPTQAYPWIRDALVYWGYYHLIRQHYGFQRLYERKMAIAGAPVSARESFFYARYLEIVSWAPLLVRFRDPELMTVRVGDHAVWIHHPVLPPWAWQTVLAIWVATVLAAVAHHLIAFARGDKHRTGRALLFAAVTIALGVATVGSRDIVVSIAVVTSFHNLQYLGLVWFHNRNRAELAEKKALPLGGNAPVDRLRRGQTWRYFGWTYGYAIAVIAPLALLPGKLLAELPLSIVVALHYYVDARIWRFRDYPDLARCLRLG